MIRLNLQRFSQRFFWLEMRSLILAMIFWREVKLKEIESLIKAVSGLFIEMIAGENSYVPGDSIEISLEAINRSPAKMKIVSVKFNQWVDESELRGTLMANKIFNTSWNLKLPTEMTRSTPYWLKENIYVRHVYG